MEVYEVFCGDCPIGFGHQKGSQQHPRIAVSNPELWFLVTSYFILDRISMGLWYTLW